MSRYALPRSQPGIPAWDPSTGAPAQYSQYIARSVSLQAGPAFPRRVREPRVVTATLA